MEKLLILAFVLLSIFFLMSASILIRLLGDILKNYENTKFIWICIFVMLLTAPALAFIVRVLTLIQMCGD